MMKFYWHQKDMSYTHIIQRPTWIRIWKFKAMQDHFMLKTTWKALFFSQHKMLLQMNNCRRTIAVKLDLLFYLFFVSSALYFCFVYLRSWLSKIIRMHFIPFLSTSKRAHFLREVQLQFCWFWEALVCSVFIYQFHEIWYFVQVDV